MALTLHADMLLILTDVDYVYLNYKDASKRKEVKQLSTAEAKKYLRGGEFAEGSMQPKVEACVEFIEKTKKKAIITSLGMAVKAVRDNFGTHFIHHPITTQ